MASYFISLTGVFIARGKEDVLVTLNQVIGESVYGEKRMSVEVVVHSLLCSYIFFLIFNRCRLSGFYVTKINIRNYAFLGK